MDQVNLELKLKTDKADAAMAESAKRGRDLFEKKGFKLNVRTGDLPLGRITGDFEKFQGSLDAATARVLAFTATTSVVYGLSSAFTRLFTDSVKLEKQLASIQAILQTSNNNLKQFSDELFKVANTTGQSFDVAAAAASEFARQGLSVEETLKATTSALVFSKIAGVDAAQAVENLTASINTFGNEALSYTDVVDTIVSLDNAFAISAGGIADGLKRVGSVASESGIQLKEIASLISVVQQVSARGAPVISNGLKTIFTRLGRQQVQESLNGIGVATQSANGEFRSQIDILTDLSNKLNTLSDSQRAFILEQVAGVYQINTLQATLKSLSGEYSLYDKAVKVASDSAGNAADRLKILTDTTDANLQRLKNNVTQFLAEVGSATVKPLLDNFVGIGNKILETLNLGAAGKEGEEAGISIGSFLLNGISSVLSGPGTILIVATVGKLLGKITKDALSALQTLSGLKQASLVDSQTQKSINEAIAQGNKALVARLATTTSIVEKTDILNKLLSDIASKKGIAQVNQAVSAGLAANKKTASPKVRAKGYIPTYSDGFIPEYLQKAEKKGTQLGGYSGKGVMLSSTGKVMSKAESEVFFPNFKESAIMPPPYSMAGRSYRKAFIQKHDMDPYEQQTASKGFIPNFAAAKNVLKRADQLGPKVIERANPQDTFQARINPVEMTSTVQDLRKKSKDILDKVYVRTKDRKAGEKGYNENALEGFENEYSSKSNKALLSRTSTFIKNIGSRGNRLRSNSSGYIEALNQIQGLLGEVEAKESFKDKSGKTKFTEGFSYFDLITENADGSQSFSEVRARAKVNSLDILKKAVNQDILNNNYANEITDNVKLGNYDVLIPKGSTFNSSGFIPNFASKYTEARQQKRDQLRASLFNIGDFAGGAIKNVNAEAEFNKARDKNPNVEWDDKINQVGFKVERIPIPDREFEAALRSKENNKEVTTKFENYAIDYLNTKGYSFKPGRNTLYGKENAAVDGYNIKQNFIELLEVKGGGWDAPDVNNKFGRFTPENLVDLGPQLVSKFFKEGNPDPNINDKIRIRNVLAIPNLIGGVFKKNIAPQYPSADVEKIEKARQRTRPSGKKIPASKLWMLGVVEQMKESGMTNASGFIPNFALRSSFMGGGAEGTFHRLNNDIGVKRFHRKAQPISSSDPLAEFEDANTNERDAALKENLPGAIKKEFEVSRFLAEQKEGFTGPKIFGNLEGSLRRKSIRKKIIEERVARDSVGPEASSVFGQILRAQVRKTGLLMHDLHGGNYTLNSQGQEFIEKNKNYFSEDSPRTPGSDESIYNKFVGSGGKATIIDAGYTSIIDKNLKNKFKEYEKGNFSSGFIPNFASRLSYKETQNAKKKSRAQEAKAGIPIGKIRMGRNPSLRTPFNPEGFGVYNKYEGSLANGMSLAKKEGIDPRTKGMFASEGFIPNFATPQERARFNELYIENIEKRKAAGKMGGEGGMGKRGSEERNIRADAIKAARKAGSESRAASKKNQTPPRNQVSVRTPPAAPSRLALTTPVNPGVSTPSQGVNTDNLKQATGRVVEKRQPRQTGPTVIPSGDTIPMSGPTGRSPQEQAKRDRQAKALRRQRAASRNQNTGAAGAFASLAIPGIVGGLLPEEGKRNQGQQAVADVAESTSSGMMAASMVGMIPKLAKFGPVVGVAVGAVMLLSKSAKNAVPSIKGLQEENDKLLASNEKQVTSLNEAVAKQEEVSQLRASGADPKKIARAQLDFAKSVSNIGDSGLKTTLLTEKDDTKRQEAVMQFQEKKKKEADFSQGVLAAATMSRNEGVQRASGGAGTLSYATSLLAKGAGAIGFKSGERALNQKAEEIKGPKKDFDASQSEAILNPIINSLDLSKASSKEASEGIKDLASGTIDMATFIEKFGKELGLSSTQVASARDTFKGLSENFSPESLKGLNEYAGGLLKINSSIQQQLARPPVVNVNFQKVLDKALQNLTFDTALTNYKNFANATANLDIEESQLTIDQQLGRVSPEEMVRKKSELTGRRERQGFEEKSSAILDEAVQGVLAVVPKNLDQKTQSSILSAAKSSLTQGGDITVLQDIIRQSLGASEDSNKILEQIEALNQKSVQSLEMLNVDMTTAEKVRQAQTEQQIAAIQSQNNKNLGDRALAGDVGSQFSLLDPVAASKLEKEISDLRDKATKAGVGTEAGKKYSAKAEAKNLELSQMRDEARKAEMETFGKEYTSAVDSTGLGAQMGQSAETDYIVSMVEKLSTAYARETGTTGISETSKEQIRASLMSGDKAAAKGILESQGAIGGGEGTDRKALSDEVLKFLNQSRTPSTPQGAAAGGAPAAVGGTPATGVGMPTPQMPGVSVPGATSATGGPAAVGSPSATGAAVPQIPGSNIPAPSSTVSPSMSALARLRDNTMLERVGQENLLEQAANEKTIQEAQEAVKQADTDAANLATFKSQKNEAGLNLRKSISSETAQEKFRALSENVGKIQTTSYVPSGPGFGSSNYAVSGSMTVDKEAAARKQQLQDFLSRAQEGKATKQEFEAIKASVTGEGAKGKSELDLRQTRSFIKEIESLGVPENLIDATAYTDEKEKAFAEKSKRSEQQAKLKNAAAAQARTRIEDLAADPTGTFEFLKDDKQKQAAVAKFKKSKDPKLEALGKKIEEDDANKKRLEEAKKLTEERKGAFGQTVEDVRRGLSQDLSKEDTAAANEALNKFKKGEINIDDESLKKYGLDQQLKQTDVQFKQQNYQDALKAQEAARNKSLASGKAIKDMGRGAVGAVNNAVYGDQVTPGIMQMVKDPKGQEAIKAYNASVVERDAKREQLSGIDASLQEAQSADTLRQQAASKVKGDLSKASATMKPEQLSQYQDTQYALSQYRSGKIDIKDKSLDSVRSQLIQAAGGEEKFNEMNAKSGKTKDLQTQREQIAKELASGESKTAQLETMMMEYLKTVTGAANQRDTAQTMGPDGKPKEEGTSTQQSTTEKREVTSNINIKIEGSAITPEFQSQLKPVIVAEVQNAFREVNKNSGEAPPLTGPPTAVV
jgi:TP901 family phage tail tape measure protein